MTIEAILSSIDAKLGVLISLADNANAIVAPTEPTIAGAGAEPLVVKQVEAAIAAAGGLTPAEPAKRGRGRPPKTETAATPAPTSAPATVAAEADPFGDVEPAAPTPRSLTEVRAALVVYASSNDQSKALKLLKDAGGVETFAQLKPERYNAVFDAAVPSGKFEQSDVRAVLVKANERRANSGLEVLKAFKNANGAPVSTLKELPEAKYVEAINAAHAVK